MSFVKIYLPNLTSTSCLAEAAQHKEKNLNRKAAWKSCKPLSGWILTCSITKHTFHNQMTTANSGKDSASVSYCQASALPRLDFVVSLSLGCGSEPHWHFCVLMFPLQQHSTVLNANLLTIHTIILDSVRLIKKQKLLMDWGFSEQQGQFQFLCA